MKLVAVECVVCGRKGEQVRFSRDEIGLGPDEIRWMFCPKCRACFCVGCFIKLEKKAIDPLVTIYKCPKCARGPVL